MMIISDFMPKIITGAWRLGLDILFPPVCIQCHTPIADQKKFLCQSCFDEIRLNSALRCPVCGNRLVSTVNPCHQSPCVLAPASGFSPPIPALIYAFKYKGLFDIHTILSGMCIAYLSRTGIDIASYSVTEIPLHSSKQRERGFNQAQILAQEIAGYFNIPHMPLLKRTVNNKQQAKIKDFSERAENMRGCFQITDAKSVAGKNIIVVDDVSTSGATLNEAATILKKYGAKKIIGLVVAKA